MMRKTILAAMVMAVGWGVASSRAADVRGDFLRLIDRPRVAAAVEVSEGKVEGALVEYRFSYAADAGHRVPGILMEGKDGVGKRPVVIYLHGTGGRKEDGLPLMRELAGRGFVMVAIDAPYHGARTTAAKGVDYQDAILRAWKGEKVDGRQEHPFFFDTVWDQMRLIDYLVTRADVDEKRIGMYGVSKGGIETYLTAAVDPRVAVAVPCIGMESFRWANENDSWHSRIGTIQNAFDAAAKEAGVAKPDGTFVHAFYERVVPGLDGEFDGPAMAALIAPRPMMTINGEIDARTPLPGLKLCTDAAGAVYKAAGAEEKFVVRIEPKTAHKVTADSQEAAVEFFVKWLKP